MPVPYQFALTPAGTPLQLTELDADFAYLTGSPVLQGLTVSGGLSVGGTSTFTGPVTTGNINITGSLTLNGFPINITGTTGSGLLVFNNGPILIAPNLGTPASGNLANCTNLPIASVNGLASGILSFLTNPSSANLQAAVVDETGTGNLVFSNSANLTSPNITSANLISPVLGTPVSGNLVNCVVPAATITGILPIANGGTGAASANLAINNLLPTQTTHAGQVLKTDGTNVSWQTEAGAPAAPVNSIQYNNGGAFGGTSNFTFDGVSTVSVGAPSTNTAKFDLYNSVNNNIVSISPAANSAAWLMVLPNSAGTAGQAISTDGAGNTYWGNFTIVVANIAALRLLPIANGQSVYVEGYYAANDGGGGVFVAFTGALPGTYIDNGGTVIVPSDGSSAWLRDTKNGVSVLWFGAKGDGVTNDTAAFNAAINSIVANTVWVPPGRYLINPITIPGYVNISGTLTGPFDGDGNLVSITRAPTILVNSNTSSAITLTGYQSSCSNLLFYYPSQVAPTAPSPFVYNPTITIQGSGGHVVSRCTFVNSYDAIRIKVGRSTVQSCIIGGFHRGIEIDNALDWVTISDTWNQVMWDIYANLPFPQPIDNWVMNNGIALEAARVDSLCVNNFNCFGRYAGISYIDSSLPIVPKNGYGRCSNLDFDFVAYGVISSSTNNSSGGYKITNMDIGANGSGFGTPGQATIELNAGGTEPSLITWQGGSVRGAWAYGSTFPSINAGQAYVSEVVNINTLGAIPSPVAPSSGINFTNIYGSSMRVYFNITGPGANLSSLTIDGFGTGLSGVDGFFVVRPGEVINMTYVGTLNWAWFTL